MDEELQNEDLPLSDEEREAIEKAREAHQAQMDALAGMLLGLRDAAVDSRLTSGIELDWDEDEDAYEGIDDANRGERSVRKPDVSGGAILSDGPAREYGSTALINITGPYTDAAAAKVADMMLPTDDHPWGITPTPRPELGALAQSQMVMRDGTPVAEVGAQIEAQAKEQAEAAQDQIRDWLTECQWHDQMRRVLETAARLGTGIIKGPYPRKVRARAVREGGVELVEEIKPYSKSINPRNFFPDPNCGDNIHNGAYCYERDTITAKRLRELKGVPGYLDDQIEQCLKEGPQKREVEDARVDGHDLMVSDWDRYEIWYYHGEMTDEDLELAGVNLGENPQAVYPASATVVNDRVIKANLSHLESGEFPYDVLTWRRREGMPWGEGVPRQIQSPQRMLTSAVRELLDNAGISGGPQIVMRQGVVRPADGQWEITPRKLWFMDRDEPVQAEHVFRAVNIPSMQEQLHAIIHLALQLAEQTAGLPMLLQGHQGSAPATARGTELVNENAHTVLRRLARNIDNLLTEPHVRRYYEYLLIYGEDTMKGDMQIDASGSSALVEREIQNQAILAMGQMAMNPQVRADFRIDGAKWFAEMAKAQRLDPKRFMVDEDEEGPVIPQEIQMQMQQMQQALEQLQQENQQLQMRAAGHEVRAQAMIQGKQLDAESRLQGKQIDAEARMMLEQYKAQSASEREHIQGQYRLELEGLRAELAAVDKQINAGKLELDRGKLQLQAEALRHQIARMEREMAEKVREFDTNAALKAASNPLDQGPIGPDTGSLKGVIQRDNYGMIPDAVG